MQKLTLIKHTNTMEEWRDIEGYEGLYQVSNEGRVKGLVSGKYRKFMVSWDGHLRVTLSKNSKKKPKLVHRLVAEAFIPNPNGLPQVNHMDENPKNNKVENLEWCTAEYNANYGTRNERISITQRNCTSTSKKVYQYTLNGELVKVWESVGECDRNGFSKGNVGACCRGGYFSKSRNKWINCHNYKGYRWSYKPL